MSKVSAKRVLLSGAMAAALLPGMAGHAQAGAFYLQEHSVSDLGAAYAGSASTANDASILYYNPAGVTLLDKGEVSLDAVGLGAQESVKDRGSTVTTLGGFGPTIAAGGPNGNNSVIASAIPSGYIAYPIYEDRVWAGLALTTPFGLSNDYKDNWSGRFDSIKSDLRTYDINPTLSAKLTDWLSVGGGPNFQHGTAELTNAVTNGASNGSATLNGDDNAWGYTLGALIRPLPGTRIGLDYRSQINYNLNGRVVVTGVPAAGPFPALNTDSAAHAKLDLPAQGTFGVSQDIGPQWTVMGQATWFGWSNFHDITATLDDTGATASSVTEGYKNTVNWSLGAQYKWTPQWTFRGGYEFDDSPTTSPYRDTRVPDANRNWFTLGTTYTFNSHFSADLSGAYIRVNNSSIDVTRNGGLATVNEQKNGGQIGLLGLGLNYKF